MKRIFLTINKDALEIHANKKWIIKSKEDWEGFVTAVETKEETFKRFMFSSSLNHAEEETENKFVRKLANYLVHQP